jgi:hypothetical protein
MRRLLALLPFVAALGCVAGPFTSAAGAYAKVSADSSAALGAAPSLLARSCVKAADAEYVQSRLSRLKFEAEGIKLPAEGDYYVPWEAWQEKAHPMGLKGGSWKDYCHEIEQTGLAFSSAVGALGSYSSALDALATGSTYEGTDIGKTVDGVNRIVASVSKSESGPSRAVTAVGNALDKFAGGVLRQVVEKDLEGYVIHADPEVQGLLTALRAYVAAARADVDVLLQAQLQVLLSFEKLTGLGERATIAPCRVGAAPAEAAPPPAEKSAAFARKGEKKADPQGPSPEIATLRREVEIQRKALTDVCRSLDQITRTSNAQNLFAFHTLALATEEEMRQTRAVLAGFEDVLGRLGVAHTALVKAGQTKEKTDLKELLGTISDLTTRLGALQAALAQTQK